MLASLSATTLADATDRAHKLNVSTIQLESREGDVAPTLLDIARERHADILIVGKRGAGQAAGLLAEGRIAIMALAEIEQARVRKAMDAFLQQRRPPPHVRPELDLGFRVSGQSVEIFEIRPRWRVFWQRRDLKWHSYEPQPEVESVEEFASLVSEDAYACFFG